MSKQASYIGDFKRKSAAIYSHIPKHYMDQFGAVRPLLQRTLLSFIDRMTDPKFCVVNINDAQWHYGTYEKLKERLSVNVTTRTLQNHMRILERDGFIIADFLHGRKTNREKFYRVNYQKFYSYLEELQIKSKSNVEHISTGYAHSYTQTYTQVSNGIDANATSSAQKTDKMDSTTPQTRITIDSENTSDCYYNTYKKNKNNNNVSFLVRNLAATFTQKNNITPLYGQKKCWQRKYERKYDAKIARNAPLNSFINNIGETPMTINDASKTSDSSENKLASLTDQLIEFLKSKMKPETFDKYIPEIEFELIWEDRVLNLWVDKDKMDDMRKNLLADLKPLILYDLPFLKELFLKNKALKVSVDTEEEEVIGEKIRHLFT